MLLVLPIPYIWRMKHATLARRLQLTGIFMLGSVVILLTILRAVYLSRASIGAGVGWIDIDWQNAQVALVAVAENGFAIVAACLPVMRPVWKKVLYGHVEGRMAREVLKSGPGGRSDDTGRKGEELITIGGRRVSRSGPSNRPWELERTLVQPAEA